MLRTLILENLFHYATPPTIILSDCLLPYDRIYWCICRPH